MSAQSDHVAEPVTLTLHRRVAANVRSAMGYHGYVQADLARMLHMPQQSISDRLRGKTAFTLNELETLAPYLGLTVAEIIEGGKTPSGPPRGGCAARDSNPEPAD
jgi:transcriptional regulator with XRE-family HTH domain